MKVERDHREQEGEETRQGGEEESSTIVMTLSHKCMAQKRNLYIHLSTM